MAEYCFECYKKYFDKNAKVENFVMDNEPDICEGCGELKITIVKIKRYSFFERLKSLIKYKY